MMGTSLRARLSEIYARRAADDVGNDLEYQDLCREHNGNMLFDSARMAVDDAKRRLEACMNRAATSRDQVREALQELNKQRLDARPETKDTSYRLIAAAYKPDWTEEQQKYFEESWRLLQSKFDYFLSFTTRYEPPGAENPLHRQYKYFILDHLSLEEFEQGNRACENLLATAIHRVVHKAHLKAFFFQDAKNDNAKVINKLEEGCRDSLVFVQLVQGVMFTDDPATNYCFFEYETARKAMDTDPNVDERIVFIVAENAMGDLPELAFVPPRYDGWRSAVDAKAAVYLTEVPHPDLERSRDLTTTLRNDIGRKLRAARSRIWDNVPA